MNTFPCPTVVICDHSDNPLAGFNSELVDSPTFIGVNYGTTYNIPRMDWTWQNPTANATYQSQLSQSDADANAQALQVQNLVGCPVDWDGGCWTDQNGNQVPTYGNQAVTFPLTCPDGSAFNYTIPAGRYMALDPTTANAIAESFAQNLALDSQICISSLPTTALCKNAQVALTVTATTANPPITWQIVSGILPPGLSLLTISGNSVLIEGTATTAGTYPFTLMALDPLGNFMLKGFILTVLGVLGGSSPAPEATTLVPYYFTLTASGGTGPYTFTVISGSLPPGLSLASNGIISGTPGLVLPLGPADGVFTSEIQVSDSTGNSCIEAVSITCVGPNWLLLNWQAPVYVPNDGNMVITANQNSLSAQINSDPTPGANGSITGTMNYGGASNAAEFTLIYSVNSGSPVCQIFVYVNNVIVSSRTVTGSGTYVNNFRLNGSPGTIKVTAQFTHQTTGDSANANLTLTNVGP